MLCPVSRHCLLHQHHLARAFCCPNPSAQTCCLLFVLGQRLRHPRLKLRFTTFQGHSCLTNLHPSEIMRSLPSLTTQEKNDPDKANIWFHFQQVDSEWLAGWLAAWILDTRLSHCVDNRYQTDYLIGWLMYWLWIPGIWLESLTVQISHHWVTIEYGHLISKIHWFDGLTYPLDRAH